MQNKPPEAPDRILLVPGFMSPRWMLYPLFRYVRARCPGAEDWDYPRVFTKLDVTVQALADRLRSESKAGRRIGLISHSFGDWVVRSALAVAGVVRVTRLVSISPVTTAVPLARWFHQLTGSLIPELEIMADEKQAAFALKMNPTINHVVYWASWDFIVKRPSHWPNKTTRHRTITGTHNSLVFQPHLWRLVADELC